MRAIWFLLLLLAWAFLAPLGFGAAPGDVIVTEIMRNPDAVSDTYGEWIELYNPTGFDIDIDGWTVGDGQSEEHTIDAGGPLVIAAGGFVVLGRNDNSSLNGGYACDYAYAGVTLGNGSDRVVIRDGSTTIDSVAYDDGAMFPDPTGASMELANPSGDNGIGSNWEECVLSTFGDGDYGTPGAANDGWNAPAGPPTITGTQHDPPFPGSADSVVVSAEVTDDGNVTQVYLYYRVDGGVYHLVVLADIGGDWYEGIIPPAAEGASVDYYLCATDDGGNVAYDPAGAPSETHGYLVEDGLPMVVINEILAAPQGDANGDGVIEVYEDEFIELYNAGTSPVDLSGWTLSDDDAAGGEFVIPSGTVIAPSGFVTLFGGGVPTGFDGNVFVDDGRIGNGLSNSGDTVELRRTGTLVDERTYGTEANHGESMIRLPDGYGAWTRPSLEGFDWDYSPQETNGAGATWTTGKSWGAIKSLFHDPLD